MPESTFVLAYMTTVGFLAGGFTFVALIVGIFRMMQWATNLIAQAWVNHHAIDDEARDLAAWEKECSSFKRQWKKLDKKSLTRDES